MQTQKKGLRKIKPSTVQVQVKEDLIDNQSSNSSGQEEVKQTTGPRDIQHMPQMNDKASSNSAASSDEFDDNQPTGVQSSQNNACSKPSTNEEEKDQQPQIQQPQIIKLREHGTESRSLQGSSHRSQAVAQIDLANISNLDLIRNDVKELNDSRKRPKLKRKNSHEQIDPRKRRSQSSRSLLSYLDQVQAFKRDTETYFMKQGDKLQPHDQSVQYSHKNQKFFSECFKSVTIVGSKQEEQKQTDPKTQEAILSKFAAQQNQIKENLKDGESDDSSRSIASDDS